MLLCYAEKSENNWTLKKFLESFKKIYLGPKRLMIKKLNLFIISVFFQFYPRGGRIAPKISWRYRQQAMGEGVTFLDEAQKAVPSPVLSESTSHSR